VEKVEEARGDAPTREGPSRSVTNAYRAGWDGIFGKKAVVGQA
jgi:hypothetical protein